MNEQGPHDNDASQTSMQRLVKWLLIVGVGVPVLVEGITFFGLVGHHVSDSGKEEASGTPAHARAPEVNIGDDLLSSTSLVERVTEAREWAYGEHWAFELTIALEKPPEKGYRIVFDSLRTEDGNMIADEKELQWEGGDEAEDDRAQTVQWIIPPGDQPFSVRVRAYDGKDARQPVQTQYVTFGKVPVQIRSEHEEPEDEG